MPRYTLVKLWILRINGNFFQLSGKKTKSLIKEKIYTLVSDHNHKIENKTIMEHSQKNQGKKVFRSL